MRRTRDEKRQEACRVACPTCGAPAGLPCSRISGVPRLAVHRERYLAEKNGVAVDLPSVALATESPIEQLLAPHLSALPLCTVQSQVQIGRYRVDFIVNRGGRSVVVECDGHEWHEKTKAQAARDKKRDREIVAAGYPVLRFAGSEIVKSPFHCAAEVLAVLKGKRK